MVPTIPSCLFGPLLSNTAKVLRQPSGEKFVLMQMLPIQQRSSSRLLILWQLDCRSHIQQPWEVSNNTFRDRNVHGWVHRDGYRHPGRESSVRFPDHLIAVTRHARYFGGLRGDGNGESSSSTVLYQLVQPAGATVLMMSSDAGDWIGTALFIFIRTKMVISLLSVTSITVFPFIFAQLTIFHGRWTSLHQTMSRLL